VIFEILKYIKENKIKNYFKKCITYRQHFLHILFIIINIYIKCKLQKKN